MIPSPITAMCILEKDTTGVGFQNGSIGQIKHNNEIKVIGTSSSGILHLESFDGKIVSSNQKGCIEVWDKEQSTCLLSIQAPLKKPIFDFDVYQSVVYFAPHCGQSHIYAYNLSSGELVKQSEEKRKHVKSVKVCKQNPQTIIVGYPKGIEQFDMDLNSLSMISLDKLERGCCSPVVEKAKFIETSEEDGLIAAVMKQSRRNQWYLYEIDMETLLVLNKRPIVTERSHQLRSGRDISHLSCSDDCWFVTLKNGICVFDMNSSKSGRFLSSTHSSSNTYSIIQNQKWIQGYKDGSCLVSDLQTSDDVEYLWIVFL